MAETSYPSPNHNTRNVTDAEYERIASRFSDDGLDGDPTGPAVVVPGTGLQVLVKAGNVGSLRGFAWEAGTTDVPLTIASNAAASVRNDAVVLRLDRATWDVRAAVRQGTAGSGVPAIVQDTGTAGVFEILLAYVIIQPSATTVTVEDRPRYIGTRIIPADNGKAPPNPRIGQTEYRPNNGQLRMWNGSKYVTVYEDTGRLELSPGFSTWEPVYSCFGRRVGEVVRLRLWYRRVGSTFSANDADGSKLGVLPATLRSTYNEAFTGVFAHAQTCQVQVRNDGEIWAANLNKDVPVNSTLYVSCTYIRELD